MRAASVACACLALLTASQAHAQADCARGALDAARTSLSEADFDATDQALDEAGRCTLTRDTLREWLELRTLVSYADERLGALEESLRGLLSLDPGAMPPASFPGPVRTRFGELGREALPLAVTVEPTVEASESGRTVGLVPTVRTDPGRLVRRTEVRARLVGAGELRPMAVDDTLQIGLDASTVEYELRVYGPGGAGLLTLGSDHAARVEVPAAPSDDTPLIAGLVMSGVLLGVAAAALTVAAVLTDGFRNGDTEVRPPTGVTVVEF